MKKATSRFIVILFLLFSGNLLAYTGCREIYKDYDSVVWEEYGIDIGKNTQIYLVLRCTSDCYNLSMGGGLQGNATLCGEKKPKGSWIYQACDEGTKHTSYGTDVGGVSDLMLSQCAKKESRRIKSENARIKQKNKEIREENKKVFHSYIQSSKEVKVKANLIISLTQEQLEPWQKDHAPCTDTLISTLSTSIVQAEKAIETFKRGMNSEDKQAEIGNEGIKYYKKSTSLLKQSIPTYESCLANGPEDTPQKVADSLTSSTLPDDDYLMPSSNKHILSAADLQNYTAQELRLIRNEIYARHDYQFSSTDLTNYFNEKKWYNANTKEISLSDIETANVRLIKSIENKKSSNAKIHNDFLIPDSNERLLVASDLERYKPKELRLIRNEIFARHGYQFSSRDLIDYFGSKRWYKVSTKDISLSDIEKKNIKLILSIENK